MSKIERVIVRVWGHSDNALGSLTIPTLLFTLMIAVLAVFMPERKLQLLGVWLMCGMLQAVGTYMALKIRLKYKQF